MQTIILSVEDDEAFERARDRLIDAPPDDAQVEVSVDQDRALVLSFPGFDSVSEAMPRAGEIARGLCELLGLDQSVFRASAGEYPQ